jgi:glycosyltransferase involved in cell wall biosynthesis
LVEDGKSGVLVRSEDPDKLAHALEDLIVDGEKRKALGRAGQERARQLFSADAIVPQYEELYRQVCRQGKS